MKYKIIITDSAGNKIVDLSDRCLSRSYELIRNRAGYIDLEFSLEDLDRYFDAIGMTVSEVFLTNANEIYVYKHETLIASGQIQYINIDASGDNHRVSVRAVGWLELFASRYTTEALSYTTEDIGAIMWDLIDRSQNETNGDFGVTEGVIQTSRDADRNYETYKNIKDALIQLSEVIGGPDFEFTPDKVFNVYYPKQGIKRDNAVFVYPGNIISLGYSQDGAEMANQIIASGAGFGDERVLSIAEDVSVQGVYKLRQKTIQFPDVSIQTTLDAHADEELRAKKGLVNLPKIEIDGDKVPRIGSYGLGDEILIKATRYQSLLEPILGWQRIEAIKVTIDANDHELVSLRLARI